jgi:putative endonuclease
MALGSRQAITALLHPAQLLCRVSDGARQYRQSKCLSADAALGRRGEDMAHRYLQRAGYAVIARNYRPSGGEAEIDIVARRDGLTVFVEVKTRSGLEYGAPDRAIGSAKQKNIVRAARRYAARAGIEWSTVRFDTIAIVPGPSGSLVHQQDAFFEGRAI